MLKGLITSLLVSMGVVSPTTNTPSFIKKEQPTQNQIQIKNANNTYSQSLMGEDPTRQLDEHVIGQDEYYYYYSYTNHYRSTSYNSYFSAIYNENVQMKERGQDNQQAEEYITEDPKDTTQFCIIQLTNYRYLYESTIDIEYNTYIRSGLPSGTKIRTYLLATNENLSAFVDIQNWSVYEQNNTMWEDIISPERGFIYDLQYHDENLVQSTNGYYHEVEFENIPIVNNTTNYIVIYTYLILPTQSYSNAYVLSQYSLNYNWIKNEEITMYGNYVIPADNYEVIDLPGLMWVILTLPFSFISTAFNLTLFPGTPYQVNISQLFLVVIGLLIFIWIIKKIIGGKMGM